MFDLEPIQARLAAATPGDWSVKQQAPADQGYAPLVVTDGDDVLYVAKCQTQGDADLIASAPTDLSDLVAEVKRLTGAILLHAATQPIEAFTPQDRELWASIGIEEVEVEVEDDTQEV